MARQRFHQVSAEGFFRTPSDKHGRMRDYLSWPDPAAEFRPCRPAISVLPEPLISFDTNQIHRVGYNGQRYRLSASRMLCKSEILHGRRSPLSKSGQDLTRLTKRPLLGRRKSQHRQQPEAGIETALDACRQMQMPTDSRRKGTTTSDLTMTQYRTLFPSLIGSCFKSQD